MLLAARGSRSLDHVVAGGGCWVHATPNGTTRRGTPQGQGGIEILAWADCGRPCDHAVRVLAVQVVRVLLQFLDRVLDIPVVPQKGDSTVQFLNKVVDAGCAQQLPMVQTVLPLRSPTRLSTSLFSR